MKNIEIWRISADFGKSSLKFTHVILIRRHKFEGNNIEKEEVSFLYQTLGKILAKIPFTGET